MIKINLFENPKHDIDFLGRQVYNKSKFYITPGESPRKELI